MPIPSDKLRSALTKALGEPAVLAADVRYDLRNPCADCPFMRTSPFHQGVAKSIPGLVESINSQSFAHTCHKTDTRPHCDGPVAGKETAKPVQHCIGSILMLLKTGQGKDLQLPLLEAMEDGRLSIEDVQALRDRAVSDKNVFTVRGLLTWYLQRLREKGCVEHRGNMVVATAEGFAALPDAQPLPTGQELRDYWLNRLPHGERTILGVLIAAHPDAVERSALDEATGYQRSSRDAYLQRMRAKQLIEEPSRGTVRASANLFD